MVYNSLMALSWETEARLHGQSHIGHEYELRQLVSNGYREKQFPLSLILKKKFTKYMTTHSTSASKNLLKHHCSSEANDRMPTGH